MEVATVIFNDKNQQVIEAQSHRTVWTGAKIKHLKEYRRREPDGNTIITLEAADEPVKCVIPYAQLVRVVELYKDGAVLHGDATALSKGGWKYKISNDDKVRAVSAALVMKEKLEQQPLESSYGKPGVAYEYQSDGTCLVFARPSYPSARQASESIRRAARPRSLCSEKEGRIGAQSCTNSKAASLKLSPDTVSKILEDDEDFCVIVKPEGLMDGEFAEAGLQTEQSSGGRAVNTFNYGQRKKMKNREIAQEEEKSYKSELLGPEFMDEVRKSTGESGTRAKD